MSDPIFRTVYQVEVFSEGPFEAAGGDNDPFDLSAINYAICEGDCVGSVNQVSSEVIPSELVASELIRIGNDGSYFDHEWEDDE